MKSVNISSSESITYEQENHYFRGLVAIILQVKNNPPDQTLHEAFRIKQAGRTGRTYSKPTSRLLDWLATLRWPTAIYRFY